jgi:hypothetical protein
VCEYVVIPASSAALFVLHSTIKGELVRLIEDACAAPMLLTFYDAHVGMCVDFIVRMYM